MAIPRIVIVGGGAGGLALATRLGHTLGKRKHAEILLLDRNTTHVWKPLLHELATGVLNSSMDEVDYRGHSTAHFYRYQRGSLTGIDRHQQVLRLAPVMDEEGEEVLPARELAYDYLVMALGSVSNDFGTPRGSRTLPLYRLAPAGQSVSARYDQYLSTLYRPQLAPTHPVDHWHCGRGRYGGRACC